MLEIIEKTERQVLWERLIQARAEKKIEALSLDTPEIRRVYEALKELSADEHARFRYESWEKAVRDEQARLYGAIKEGEARGRAEGMHKAAIEAARNLLKMGISVDLVAQGTALTVEEVQKLQDQADVPASSPRKPGRRRKESVPA